MKKIAEVAVPVSLALDETFDYRVPAHCRALLAVGCRVRVPFGRRQLIGYVTAFKSTSRYEKKLKALSDCLDLHGPLLNERLMSLARFLSREYFCSLAQGFETVLPRPLRMAIDDIASAEPQDTASALDPLTRRHGGIGSPGAAPDHVCDRRYVRRRAMEDLSRSDKIYACSRQRRPCPCP